LTDQENVFSTHKYAIQILEEVQFFLRKIPKIKYMYITHKVKKIVYHKLFLICMYKEEGNRLSLDK